MTNLLLAIHGWSARKEGRGYRILCSVLRLAVVTLEGAPREVVKMELRILKEKVCR